MHPYDKLFVRYGVVSPWWQLLFLAMFFLIINTESLVPQKFPNCDSTLKSRNTPNCAEASVLHLPCAVLDCQIHEICSRPWTLWRNHWLKPGGERVPRQACKAFRCVRVMLLTSTRSLQVRRSSDPSIGCQGTQSDDLTVQICLDWSAHAHVNTYLCLRCALIPCGLYRLATNSREPYWDCFMDFATTTKSSFRWSPLRESQNTVRPRSVLGYWIKYI